MSVYTLVALPLFLNCLDANGLLFLLPDLLSFLGLVKFNRGIAEGVDSRRPAPPRLVVLEDELLPFPLVPGVSVLINLSKELLSLLDEIIGMFGFVQGKVFFRIVLDEHFSKFAMVEEVDFAFFEVKFIELPRPIQLDEPFVSSH